MKKLMIVASAALCAAVGFGDVESSNVVGYNTDTTGSDNNFVTIPFATVGYNTSDIQQFKIVGDGVGYGTETFSVWEGVPTVVEGSEFTYWDATMDPDGEATESYWGDSSCIKASFSIAPGQSIAINCSGDLVAQTSGEVSDGKVEFSSVEGNNFTGNPFPAEIDIQAIKIAGDGVGYGTETFTVWEGAPTVVEGSEFTYWDATMDPDGEATESYWGDSSCVKVKYPISIGQGFVINCTEGRTVSMEAPYSR